MIYNLIFKRNDFTISEELLEPFLDVLNWSKVSESWNINFSEELLDKYRSLLDWQLLRGNPQVIELLD